MGTLSPNCFRCPEVHGLLVLILLHDPRRVARFSDGELGLLGEKDRSQWNSEQIASGRAEHYRALGLRGRGTYVLKVGSPIVELSAIAIAVVETEGSEAGVRVLDRLGLGDSRYTVRNSLSPGMHCAQRFVAWDVDVVAGGAGA